jgi:hypothetical protein
MTYPDVSVIERDSPQGKRENANAINNLLGRVNVLERLIVELVPAGYGQAAQIADITPYNIPITPTQIIMPFDTDEITPSRGVTFDLVADTFSFTVKGVWQLSIGINLVNFTVDNANPKIITVSIFNVDTAIRGADAAVVIPRGAIEFSFNSSTLVDVPEAVIGDNFRIEITSDLGVTNGTLIDASLAFVHISELGALL